jgi:hypothetical protein
VGAFSIQNAPCALYIERDNNSCSKKKFSNGLWLVLFGSTPYCEEASDLQLFENFEVLDVKVRIKLVRAIESSNARS